MKTFKLPALAAAALLVSAVSLSAAELPSNGSTLDFDAAQALEGPHAVGKVRYGADLAIPSEASQVTMNGNTNDEDAAAALAPAKPGAKHIIMPVKPYTPIEW